MPDVSRLARTLCALPLLLAPVLSGCVKDSPLTRAEQDSDARPQIVSAREYGFVRPAVDISSLEATDSGKGLATTGGGGNLWTRVRAGMRLQDQHNPRVEAVIARFKRDPRYLTRLNDRARPYLRLIVDEIARRGLPMELALLPQVESRYNPGATSSKAAAGIWQFMPYTGRAMGLRQDQWYDERRDVLASTRAALDYLEQLNAQFDGDWALTMAAYNCGPGCVANAVERNRRQGKPTDFWSLQLPTETRDYVPQILATARLVATPGQYGLALPPLPDRPQLELIRTPGAVELAKLASASGVELATLKRLNPGLKRARTAPGAQANLLVPAGSGALLRKALAQAEVVTPAAYSASSRVHIRERTTPQARPAVAVAKPVRTTPKALVHVVKRGETLSAIARRHDLGVRALAESNHLDLDDTLRPGQKLRIPGSNALVTYRVRSGDSMSVIARRYGVTVDDLQRWNALSDSRLDIGDTLRIYRKS
ncbi:MULTISPECIES: LysM peptidoglycan-binding domain-containing protein [Marichromatium]|uniref:Membrane-bound lytic murein transglycosylase D n=1 Tax=Marichromatium gracile TaxID=1048 RepID=A0A4R4AE08_MARGR|nr:MULTISPECIES: LysM peptidoglycan-binding domain-containing protein [Marichromatium]MBK1709238.1 lytic transglycosylase [Marichromatium gracile]RNE90559.1 LysM peptidoglycan-binding domain-containing protein [Marichromatium sp. AB31]RNE94037.1 LysM peptidoglycan-binding domain-containing protein [Marichromatium sp. AB32]TCW37134.1 membrane-bound lytic murein transglycosylase D [Marichromatium gracile]